MPNYIIMMFLNAKTMLLSILLYKRNFSLALKYYTTQNINWIKQRKTTHTHTHTHTEARANISIRTRITTEALTGLKDICITNLNVERASAARNKKRDSRCAIKSSRPSLSSTSGI